MMELPEPIRGRGAANNPANRFERLCYEIDPRLVDDDGPSPKTQFYRDKTRTILAHNDSPDVGFDTSINPYRGCEHGCVYCYARPTHEYLGLSAGLDFETKILVKEEAPELLRRELLSPRWQPRVISLSGVTDPYQPIERRLGLTRRCLEVLAEFRNPLAIITKNALVTRDVDVLGPLAEYQAAAVFVSVTTLDGELARRMEPRASHPDARLEAIRTLTKANIPVGVMVAPLIPGLNDHEMPAILTAACEAGARYAGYVPLRLPLTVRPIFEQWLSQHFPDRKEKVLGRLRSLRGGPLNDPHFGSRMRGQGTWARLFNDLFHLACQKVGFARGGPALSTAAFRRPTSQPLLFD